jgi:hypothetical protein
MKLDEYTTIIDGSAHWSFMARRGTQITLKDIDGGANVGMLFYNPHMLSEKFNAPDTLKSQHTFKLTKGHCLYSDMGRIFCSIIKDSFGWHDSVCGNSHAAHVESKWRKRSYQTDTNQWLQNGYDSFLVELSKYNLGRRDLAANMNFFSKVTASKEGDLVLSESSSKDASITLRFEMDTLVILHTCPHPLNNSTSYQQKPIELTLEKAPTISTDDYCMNLTAENQRGFKNNALYHLGLN